VTTVRNYHLFNGIKKHKFALLPFWRSEVAVDSYRAKIKQSAGLVAFGGSSMCRLFQLSGLLTFLG
jgi:hypothetical protein